MIMRSTQALAIAQAWDNDGMIGHLGQFGRTPGMVTAERHAQAVCSFSGGHLDGSSLDQGCFRIFQARKAALRSF